MKKCECGNSKWKSFFEKIPTVFQCLKCYKVYTRREMLKLKNVKEKK